ncbi:MAG: response regulator transcription factor [Candidatus Eisenbacteria bacterium]
MRVFIADDDLVSRRTLEVTLKKQGFEVEIACDGKEAWEGLQKENAPKLVILDWMMPHMDGVDLCRKLREIETSEPVYIILLTAKSEKSDIIEGLEAGASDYLVKPFDPGELRARIGVGCRVVELQHTIAERVRELEEASQHIETLQGILPICMHCHKIRNDTESWDRIDSYIEAHSEAQFSHSLCPECLEKYYPDDDEADEKSGSGETSPAGAASAEDPI